MQSSSVLTRHGPPLAMAALTLLLAACGGGGGDDTPPPPPAACTSPCIGSAGGSVAGPNGASLAVPANAVASNVTFAIVAGGAAPPSALPAQFVAAGTVHEFTPHGQSFTSPATVTVPLDPARVPAGTTPVLLRINPGQSAWQTVSGATRNGNAMTAQVSSLSWFVVATPAVAPTIATQPAAASVTAGATASFSVVAAGTPTPTFQWRRNGTDIAGATAASYTTPATTLADNGARFSVAVTNSAGSVVSSEALLTVVAPPSGRVDLRGRLALSVQAGIASPGAQGYTRMHLVDSTGTRREVALGADGTFAFEDVAALPAPLLLFATDAAGSLDDIAAAALRTTPTATIDVTVTALSESVLGAALARRVGVFSIADGVTTAQALTTAALEAGLARVRTTVGPIVTALGGDAATFDPATSPLAAAVDDMLQWAGELANGDTRWINGHALLPDDAGAQLVTTGTPLPAPAFTQFGYARPFLAAMEACFKLPVADRASVDSATGRITALRGACASLPVAADYSQNRGSFTDRYANWLLDPRTVDARFSAFIMGALTPLRTSIATVISFDSDRQFDWIYDTLGRADASATSWSLVGNQRLYELFVQAEYRRTIYLAPPPANPTSIFQTSHQVSGLYIHFDPNNGAAAANVRAIRVKGRGLPAAGVVLTRSTSCDRSNRFVIANKTGDASVASSGNRASTFVLQAIPATAGGPLGPWNAADPTFADAPLSDTQMLELRGLEPYVVELFRTGDTTTPSETLIVRTGTPPQRAALFRGINFGWNTLSAETLDYLDPTRPQAAASPTLPMGWTLVDTPFGARTPSPSEAYVFTRGTVDGVANRRVNDGIGFLPGSRSSVVFNSNTPPASEANPCTASAFPAATTAPSDFRGFGLFWQYQSNRFLSEYQWQQF